MIKILKNKNIVEFLDLDSYIKKYKTIHIDLGTGNGKFIFDLALKNPEILFIGIEPIASNLLEYSKKAQKNKLENLIYVISSIENLGTELNGLGDVVYVNFPWGSLLEAVVKDMPEILNKISALGNDLSVYNFTFAYSSIHEPSEIEKRGLPILTEEYLLVNLREIYKQASLEIIKCDNLKAQDINKFGTLWAKKLFLGKSRDVYRITSKKIL